MSSLDNQEQIIPYTANLAGVIKSHLAGLQGYDVMALELIQNADDARADEIIFNVTDKGLIVLNNSQFSYCGEFKPSSPCPFISIKGEMCDFHRIADVGSGGKLVNSENTGRFGIGFVSTYQITDRPQIGSAGITMTLHPESGQCIINKDGPLQNTTFFLPWANDPQSHARRALDVSPILDVNISQLVDDIKSVFTNGLLFLRNIRHAQLLRNDIPVFSCNINHISKSNIEIQFSSGNKETWHFIRIDARQELEKLFSKYPRLKDLNRHTNMTIGIRVEPQLINEGFLYAFLPTRQQSGLPLHINADFFPESDRKSLIFSGNQHEQAWNEKLIEISAYIIGKKLKFLFSILGAIPLWNLINYAYTTNTLKNEHYPSCYKWFWEYIQKEGANSEIALSCENRTMKPIDVLFAHTLYQDNEVKALSSIGIQVLSHDLKSFFNPIQSLGMKKLSLEHLVPRLKSFFNEQFELRNTTSEVELENFFIPILRIIDDLIPDNTIIKSADSQIKRQILSLMDLPLIVTEDFRICNISNSVKIDETHKLDLIVGLLPMLNVMNRALFCFRKLSGMIPRLDLSGFVKCLYDNQNANSSNLVFKTDKSSLMKLYELLLDLDYAAKSGRQNGNNEYLKLRKCRIWLSRKSELITLEEAVLPGDFQDPTETSNLLDTSILSEDLQHFLVTKLAVKKQSIDEFVRITLPRIFDSAMRISLDQYFTLIDDLSSHQSLLDHDDIVEMLSNLPIVPTSDGGWSQPNQVYIKTDELISVFGDACNYWLDQTRIPQKRQVLPFFINIGLLEKPAIDHLVKRMVDISLNEQPSEENKKFSSEAFYAICEEYEACQEEQKFIKGILELKNTACFPADDDTNRWYLPEELFVPFRSETIRSQVKILDFKNTQRLNTELLKDLGVKEPNTQIVIKHLLHCVCNNTPPHNNVYRHLDEKALADYYLIRQLSDEPILFINDIHKFVTPCKVFQTDPNLGDYAFKLPSELDSFRNLIKILSIKNSPNSHDYVEVLIELVKTNQNHLKIISEIDLDTYKQCLSKIASACSDYLLEDDDLVSLQDSPSIMNLFGALCYPKELLLDDSDWYSDLFDREINDLLCKPLSDHVFLYESLGIKLLSQEARIELRSIKGTELKESNIIKQINEKVEIISRLLHDQISTIQTRVKQAFDQIDVVSCDEINIQVTLELGHIFRKSSIKQVDAFYDANKDRLYLKRPIDSNKYWFHIFRNVFNQLLSGESSSVIKSIVLSMNMFMNLPLPLAHQQLDDADYPKLNEVNFKSEESTIEVSGLDSNYQTASPEQIVVETAQGEVEPDMFQISTGDILDENNQENAINGTVRENRTNTELNRDNLNSVNNVKQENRNKDVDNKPVATNEEYNLNQNRSENLTQPQDLNMKTDSADSDDDHENQNMNKQDKNENPIDRAQHNPGHEQNEHRTQMNRRLLSYVDPQDQNSETDSSNPDVYKHNLSVESIARTAVCNYEEKHHRTAIQMPQDNPGYDIKSFDTITGEERYIEVKSIRGEWNKVGVGLSKFQFDFAQVHGDKFWLYVVELATEAEHAIIHPIQNPTKQITTFMFDENWKRLSENDFNPSSKFVQGVKIEHATFGKGTIISTEMRGTSILLSIVFENSPDEIRKSLLNLSMMKVLEV